jgi:hypothetical protein
MELNKQCNRCDRIFTDNSHAWDMELDWDKYIPEECRVVNDMCDGCFDNWNVDLVDYIWHLEKDIQNKIPHKYLEPYMEVIICILEAEKIRRT